MKATIKMSTKKQTGGSPEEEKKKKNTVVHTIVIQTNCKGGKCNERIRLI